MRPVFEHLVLSGPTIEHFYVQVALFSEITGCLLQRGERLTKECYYGASLQQMVNCLDYTYEVIVAHQEEVVILSPFLSVYLVPLYKPHLLLLFFRNVELLHYVELFDCQRFCNQGCHLHSSSLNDSTNQKTSTLIPHQSPFERTTIKQHQSKNVPTNATNGFEFIFEVMKMYIGQGRWLCVDMEEVLSLFFLDVLFL